MGAKDPVTVRLTPAGRQRIAERAERADIHFSHMLRRMLAYADQHMPESWVPPRRTVAMEQGSNPVGHETPARGLR